MSRAWTNAGSAATGSCTASGTTWPSRRPPRPTTTGSSTRCAVSNVQAAEAEGRSIHVGIGPEIRGCPRPPLDAALPPLSLRLAARADGERRLRRPARLARPGRHAARGDRGHRLQPPGSCRCAARRLLAPAGQAHRRHLAQSAVRADICRRDGHSGHRHRAPTRPQPGARRSAAARAPGSSPRRVTIRATSIPSRRPTRPTRFAPPISTIATGCIATSPPTWRRSGRGSRRSRPREPRHERRGSARGDRQLRHRTRRGAHRRTRRGLRRLAHDHPPPCRGAGAAGRAAQAARRGQRPALRRLREPVPLPRDAARRSPSRRWHRPRSPRQRRAKSC